MNLSFSLRAGARQPAVLMWDVPGAFPLRTSIQFANTIGIHLCIQVQRTLRVSGAEASTTIIAAVPGSQRAACAATVSAVTRDLRAVIPVVHHLVVGLLGWPGLPGISSIGAGRSGEIHPLMKGAH